MTDAADRWLSAQDISDLTGLTIKRVYALIRAGELPGKKFGKYRKVLARDYETWANSLPDASPLARASKARAA